MTTVIFDFDYTLFDTYRFKKELGKSLLAKGVNEELFWQTYKKTVDRDQHAYDYDIKYQLKLINEQINIDLEQAYQIVNQTICKASDYTYPETKEVLDALIGNEEYRLVLLTLGNSIFQQAKVEYSGIAGYFKEILITPFSKVYSYHVTIPQNGKVIFVSDSLKEIYEIQRDYPEVKAILKIRQDKNYNLLPDNIIKINNLLELQKIVH